MMGQIVGGSLAGMFAEFFGWRLAAGVHPLWHRRYRSRRATRNRGVPRARSAISATTRSVCVP
jgi:hypothetical protein